MASLIYHLIRKSDPVLKNSVRFQVKKYTWKKCFFFLNDTPFLVKVWNLNSYWGKIPSSFTTAPQGTAVCHAQTKYWKWMSSVRKLISYMNGKPLIANVFFYVAASGRNRFHLVCWLQNPITIILCLICGYTEVLCLLW